MHSAERANERYRLLARHIPNAAVALFDRNLSYLMVDGSLIREWGVDPKKYEGQELAQAITDIPLRDMMRRKCKAVFEGESHYIQFQWEEAVFAWDIAPIYDHESVYMGMLFVRDITEEFRTREEIERLLGEAQTALRIRDDFLSVAAHELKTPLTSIIGFAQLLKHRAWDDLKPADRKVLQVVLHQSDKLNGMINAVLDVSRIAQGRLDIRKAPHDLAALVSQMCEQMQITTEHHTIASTLPDELPFSFDQSRIEQVVRNLISNAIKYMPDGGHVSLSLDHVGNEAILSVTDHGIGIPAEALEHLFEQYYRAENVGTNVNTGISGLGVGLYVSNEIVKQHGGTLTALSDGRYKGATFIMRLPI